MKRFYITTFFLIALFVQNKTMAQSPCHVSFYLDTISSTQFNGVIVNTSASAPALPDTMVFGWFWGDGTSGSWGERYPKSHTYSSPGYKTISVVVSTNFNCKDSFARTIFIDTLGGFHKINAAYNITVVPPGKTGIKNTNAREFVSIQPSIIKNNATLNFSGLNAGSTVEANVYSYDGKNVISLKEELSAKSLTLQTGTLKPGMYFVYITSGNQTTLLKFMKQ
jgi:hypothetical protein